MSEQKDGGPAFPGHSRTQNDIPAPTGMSLRDWFAGQALAGMCAANNPETSWNDDVNRAYALADAMLKARTNAH